MSSLMQVSSTDKISFTIAMEQQVQKVAGLWRKKHGTMLQPPPHLLSAMKIWRRMAQRYSLDIKRNRTSCHSVDEEKAEQELAQWLLTTWHELNGTKPEEPYKFAGFQ
jgi:hypothetical protein